MGRVRTSIGAALLVYASVAVGLGASWAGSPRPLAQRDASGWGASSKGRLGIVPLAISPGLREAFGAPAEHGVLVDRVSPDSPAAKAGIRPGDVIAEVDGEPVEGRDDVVRAIADKKAGDPVVMHVFRNRQSLVIAAKLEEDPAPAMFGPDADEEEEDLPGGGKRWSLRWHGDGDDPMPMPDFALPLPSGSARRLEERIEALEQKIEALQKQLDARR